MPECLTYRLARKVVVLVSVENIGTPQEFEALRADIDESSTSPGCTTLYSVPFSPRGDFSPEESVLLQEIDRTVELVEAHGLTVRARTPALTKLTGVTPVDFFSYILLCEPRMYAKIIALDRRELPKFFENPSQARSQYVRACSRKGAIGGFTKTQIQLSTALHVSAVLTALQSTDTVHLYAQLIFAKNVAGALEKYGFKRLI